MVEGLAIAASHACCSSIGYVGRSLGILFRQPATKSREAGEKVAAGRSGGVPSTIAYEES